MEIKDLFELNKATYDLSRRVYIYRINNRTTGELTNIIVDQKLDNNVGKLVKKDKIAQLSFSSRNPKKEIMEIVSFNIPEEKIAYKAVFGNGHKKPLKIFKSTKENEWSVLTNPSEEIYKMIIQERIVLKSMIIPSKNEGPVLF